MDKSTLDTICTEGEHRGGEEGMEKDMTDPIPCRQRWAEEVCTCCSWPWVRDDDNDGFYEIVFCKLGYFEVKIERKNGIQ